jgi:phenylalanyl-tRNA synthetase alpha chain
MAASNRGPVPITRDLPQDILTYFSNHDSLVTSHVFPTASQTEIKAAIDRLHSREMVEYDTKETEVVLLTPESEQICEEGSPEFKVWDVVRRKGRVAIKELPVCCLHGCWGNGRKLTK